MSTLFISYSSKDRITADVFYEKLVEMGYEKPFRDDHPDSGIPAGSEWEAELYRKLRLCKALIVLCSRNWLESKWCFAELAYAKAEGKEFFPVQIDDSPDVPTVVAERQSVRLSDPNVWERLKRGLAEAGLAPENDFPWPVDGVDACPYPGLASFEACHAGVYFGRDEEILKLRELLNQMIERREPRLLYVVGASGSGKSSLVKAGLLPRLTRKESSRWCVLPSFRWNEVRARGRDWTEELALGLISLWPKDYPTRPDWRTLRLAYDVDPVSGERRPGATELAAYKSRVAAAAERFVDDTKDMLVATNRQNATAIIVIDQFEEILSVEDDPTVTAFLDFLSCLMASPRSPWLSIVTVRSDFLTAIQTRAELIPLHKLTGVYSLSLLSPERFYDVIRRPAEKVGIVFDPESLVNRMVNDAGTNDALPLLAFALRELYERCGEDHRFTLDEYVTQLGGLEGCLTRTANEVVSESTGPDETSKDLRERRLHLVFSNYLVRVNDKNQFVRRTVAWSELPEEARPLLQRFIDRRLITSRLSDETNPNSERVIEVAHEALFRRWDKLARWLDERRDLLRWRRDIERDRAASGAKWAGLTRSQLAVARDWPTERREELGQDELRWIHNGILGERVRRGLVAIVVVSIATLAVVARLQQRQADIARASAEKNERIAKQEKTKAEANFRIAESRRLAAVSESVRSQHYDTAILLALEALAEDTLEARGSLQRCVQDRPEISQFLHVPEGKVSSVACDSRGRIALGYEDDVSHGGGVVLFDEHGGRTRLTPLELREGSVESVAFDARGRLAAGYRGAPFRGCGVLLFDAQGDPLRTTYLGVDSSDLGGVAFDSQGRLAVGYRTRNHGAIALFDEHAERMRREPLDVKEGEVRSVAFDAQGRFAAAYNQGYERKGGIVLFDARGERVRTSPLKVDEGRVTGVAFDGQGRIAAGYDALEAAGSGGVVLFDARGERVQPLPLNVNDGTVEGVAFDAQDRIAASYSGKFRVGFGTIGGVALFNARGQLLRSLPLQAEQDRVSSVAFDAQGRIAAGYRGVGLGGGAVLLDPQNQRRASTVVDLKEGQVRSVACDAQGRIVAGYVEVSGRSGVAILDADGTRSKTVMSVISEGDVSSVAIDAQGRIAAGYARDARGGVVIFDSHGQRLKSAPLEVTEGRVTTVAFDANGDLAVGYSANRIGGVVLFDAQAKPTAALAIYEGPVTSVAFDTHGRIAAGYSAAQEGPSLGGVVLFDARGERIRPESLEVKEGFVICVAFDTRGRIAAAYNAEGPNGSDGIVLFNPQGERESPLEVSEGYISCLAFDAQGRIAAGFRSTATEHGGVVLFDAHGDRMWPLPLDVVEGAVNSVAFDTRGRIAAGFDNPNGGGVALIDADPGSWRRKVERVANRNFTWREWQRYFPLTVYRRTIRTRPWPVDLPPAERTRADAAERAANDGSNAR